MAPGWCPVSCCLICLGTAALGGATLPQRSPSLPAALAAQIDEYNAWMMLFLFLPALVCGLATYAFWAVPRGKTRFEDAGRRLKDKVSAG